MKSESGSDSTVGKYCCPECAGKFDKLVFALYPEGAPWYVPQNTTPRCPHCGCWLSDKVSISALEMIVFVFYIGLMVSVLFHYQWDWLRAAVFVVLLLLFSYKLFTLRHIRSEHRYAAAKRQKPEKQ